METCKPITGNAGCFPALLPDQIHKLKQLSVLTLAETEKVLICGPFYLAKFQAGKFLT